MSDTDFQHHSKRSRIGVPSRKQLLTHIPTDLIHLIFGFLWYDELIGPVNRTCKALQQIIKDGGHDKIEQPHKITDIRKFVVTVARLLFNQPLTVVDPNRKYPNAIQRDLDILQCQTFSLLHENRILTTKYHKIFKLKTEAVFKKRYFYLSASIMNMLGYPEVRDRYDCIMRTSALPLHMVSFCNNITWFVAHIRHGWTRVVGNEFTTFSKHKCVYRGITLNRTNMPDNKLSYTEWQVLHALIKSMGLDSKLSEFYVDIHPFDTWLDRSRAAENEPVQLTVHNTDMRRIMSVLQLEC